MTTAYYFAALYKKNGVGTAPSSTPTITIRDTTNGSTVATAQAMSAVTGLTGMYSYSYSGADGLRLLAVTTTTDTTMDETDIGLTPEISDTIFTNLNGTISGLGARLPAALTSNGNMKSSVLEIITTALSEGATGRIAAAWQAFWNVTSPVATAQSVNQSANNDTKISQILADYARRTGDYSVFAAGQQVDLVNAPNATAIAAIQSGLATPATVWNRLTSALTTSGSIGKLIVDYLDAAISGVPAATWAYSGSRTLTQSAASVAAAVVGDTITVVRGDTWMIDLTGLGSLANMSKLYFTVKSQDVADALAELWVDYPTGLLAIYGGGTITAGNASIVVLDADLGNVRITLWAMESAKIPVQSYSYDVQIVRSAGVPVTTMTKSTFVVTQDVTRAVS